MAHSYRHLKGSGGDFAPARRESFGRRQSLEDDRARSASNWASVFCIAMIGLYVVAQVVGYI